MKRQYDDVHDEILNERNTIECCICLEDINPRTQGFLDCKHIFCYDCIQSWLRVNKVCPICKRETNRVKICYNLFPIPTMSNVLKYFAIDKIVHSKVENDDYNKRKSHYCEALGKKEYGNFRYPKYCHYYGTLHKVLIRETGLMENMYICSGHARMLEDPSIFLSVVERKFESLAIQETSTHSILLNTFEKGYITCKDYIDNIFPPLKNTGKYMNMNTLIELVNTIEISHSNEWEHKKDLKKYLLFRSLPYFLRIDNLLESYKKHYNSLSGMYVFKFMLPEILEKKSIRKIGTFIMYLREMSFDPRFFDFESYESADILMHFFRKFIPDK